MEENSTIQLNVKLDSKLADQFQAVIDRWGDKQGRVISALIRVWLCLPRTVQSLMQDNTLTPEEAYRILVQQLVDAEIYARMRNPKFASLRENFLALLKSVEPPQPKDEQRQ